MGSPPLTPGLVHSSEDSLEWIVSQDDRSQGLERDLVRLLAGTGDVCCVGQRKRQTSGLVVNIYVGKAPVNGESEAHRDKEGCLFQNNRRILFLVDLDA